MQGQFERWLLLRNSTPKILEVHSFLLGGVFVRVYIMSIIWCRASHFELKFVWQFLGRKNIRIISQQSVVSDEPKNREIRNGQGHAYLSLSANGLCNKSTKVCV